jgi:CheY-like chemotaxis protein
MTTFARPETFAPIVLNLPIERRPSVQSAGSMVLLVSRDSALRATQERVFRAAGYSILTAGSPTDAERILRNVMFRLVIVDHTLNQTERRELVSLTRSLAPRTFVVVLHASGQDCGADLSLDSRLGVETVLQQVGHLLAKQDF